MPVQTQRTENKTHQAHANCPGRWNVNGTELTFVPDHPVNSSSLPVLSAEGTCRPLLPVTDGPSTHLPQALGLGLGLGIPAVLLLAVLPLLVTRLGRCEAGCHAVLLLTCTLPDWGPLAALRARQQACRPMHGVPDMRMCCALAGKEAGPRPSTRGQGPPAPPPPHTAPCRAHAHGWPSWSPPMS